MRLRPRSRWRAYSGPPDSLAAGLGAASQRGGIGKGGKGRQDRGGEETIRKEGGGEREGGKVGNGSGLIGASIIYPLNSAAPYMAELNYP